MAVAAWGFGAAPWATVGARGPLVVGEIWDDGLTVGEVTLGGRRLLVERPRVRTADRGAEVPLCTYTHFASRDPLTALVFGAHPEPGWV